MVVDLITDVETEAIEEILPTEESVVAEPVVSAVEQFLIDHGELVVEVLSLIKWWLFIGVPLLCIITLFWIVYKQFLYTNI